MGTAGREGTAESWAVGTEGPWGQRDIGTEGTEGTPGSLTEAQLSPSGSLCWLQPRAPRDLWVGDTEVTPALLSRHFRGLGVTCSHLTAVPSLAAALMSFRDDFISFYFLSFPPGVTETTTRSPCPCPFPRILWLHFPHGVAARTAQVTLSCHCPGNSGCHTW